MTPAETLAVIGALGGIPPFRYKGRKAKVPDPAREAAAQAKRARKAWKWAKACAATEEGRLYGKAWLADEWGNARGRPRGHWDAVCQMIEVHDEWVGHVLRPRVQWRILTRRSRDPIGRCWGHSRSQMLRRLRSLSRRLRKLPRLEMRACLRGER